MGPAGGSPCRRPQGDSVCSQKKVLLVAGTLNSQTDDRQTKYRNPHCTCTPRANLSHISSVTKEFPFEMLLLHTFGS